MTEIRLFENDRGIITCLKMATRTDEYTQKLIKIMPVSRQSPDKVPTLSGENPRKSVLLEEKRIEEKRTEDVVRFAEFWENYPRKDDKQKAAKAFKRLPKKKQDCAIEDVKIRFVRLKKEDVQFVPYGATYLNNARWEDEIPESTSAHDFTVGAI